MFSKNIEKLLKIVLPVLLVALFISIWQLLSHFEIINSALFPKPGYILTTIIKSEGLWAHILSSFYRLFISVSVGYFFGFFVGLLISNNKRFLFIEDIMAFFMSIPGISWAPLFIILIGFGDKTIILVGIITAFFPAMYNIYHGLKEIDKNILHLGDLLDYTGFEKIIRIRLPSIMNYILIALKLSFARTWRTIIAVEMIAATLSGLGYMIFDARELLNMPIMFGGIFISGIVYILIEKIVIRLLEVRTVIRWGMKVKE